MEDAILKSRTTLAHIAVARGWVNGLELSEMVDRYLPALGDFDGHVDLRVAKGTLARVLEDLSLAGKRMGHADANVLYRQSKRMRENSTGPTWEDFVGTIEDASEFSEGELIEVYKERFGEDKAQTSRARLINRQLKFLKEIESNVGLPMGLNDEVGAWFVESLAERLVKSGLKTISALGAAMLAAPEHWYIDAPGVSGVGSGKAARMHAMLEAHLGELSDIAHRIGYQAPQDRPALTISTITPTAHSLGQLTVLTASPQQAIGMTRSKLAAKNDVEAMETWLGLKASSLTKLYYKREVLRLISWAQSKCGKTLEQLTVEDALRYKEFLCESKLDLVKKGPTRGFRSEVTQPNTVKVAGFTKDLSVSSVKKALVVVSAFLKWGVANSHYSGNPFTEVKMTASLPGLNERTTRAADVEQLKLSRAMHETVLHRTLPHEAIVAVRSLLSEGSVFTEEARMQAHFIFEFAVNTGLRISELAAAQLDHLKYVDTADGSGGWELEVIGKRAKTREVPFPSHLVEHLREYLDYRKVLALGEIIDKEMHEGIFLVGAVKSSLKANKKAAEDGIRPQAIHHVLKKLFDVTIQNSDFENPEAVKRLKASTAHWLRHTAASLAVAAGVPLDVTRDILGHSNLATTSRYVHPDKERKMQEMKRLWAAIPKAN